MRRNADRTDEEPIHSTREWFKREAQHQNTPGYLEPGIRGCHRGRRCTGFHGGVGACTTGCPAVVASRERSAGPYAGRDRAGGQREVELRRGPRAIVEVVARGGQLHRRGRDSTSAPRHRPRSRRDGQRWSDHSEGGCEAGRGSARCGVGGSGLRGACRYHASAHQRGGQPGLRRHRLRRGIVVHLCALGCAAERDAEIGQRHQRGGDPEPGRSVALRCAEECFRCRHAAGAARRAAVHDSRVCSGKSDFGRARDCRGCAQRYADDRDLERGGDQGAVGDRERQQPAGGA